jgi:hypothetical protein
MSRLSLLVQRTKFAAGLRRLRSSHKPGVVAHPGGRLLGTVARLIEIGRSASHTQFPATDRQGFLMRFVADQGLISWVAFECDLCQFIGL